MTVGDPGLGTKVGTWGVNVYFTPERPLTTKADIQLHTLAFLVIPDMRP